MSRFSRGASTINVHLAVRITTTQLHKSRTCPDILSGISNCLMSHPLPMLNFSQSTADDCLAIKHFEIANSSISSKQCIVTGVVSINFD